MGKKRINDPSEKMKEDQFIMSKNSRMRTRSRYKWKLWLPKNLYMAQKVLWFTDKSQKSISFNEENGDTS